MRRLGEELGIPRGDAVPAPVPGTGPRRADPGRDHARSASRILQEADAIFIEELRESGWYDRTSQAFAVLLPVKTVGVMGDGRTYESVLALRAVTTEDFMTADWARLPARPPRPRLAARRGRGARREPRRLRRHVQAPRHDRVGVRL